MIEACTYGILVFFCVLGLFALFILMLLHIFKTDNDTITVLMLNDENSRNSIIDSILYTKILNLIFTNVPCRTIYICADNSDVNNTDKINELSDDNLEIIIVDLNELISLLRRKEHDGTGIH